VGLERRVALALLLDRLTTEHLAQGSALVAAALFAAAWPGERALQAAAAHRVRVGIATLRKLGLKDAIETLPDGGYALSKRIQVSRG
jgi:hypothetical protein